MGFNPSSLRLESVEAAHAAHGKRRGELIGAALEEARGRLLKTTAALVPCLEEHARPLLEAAQKQLALTCCRIGIVGQVKAGKSTFINALVQQPRLLPTDINPCTAVVTVLNFRTGAPAEHAAVFRMFSAEEWTELAEGGGYLRELTQRLVPNFHPELLKAQLEFMRNRAERRLGPDFRKLLGQCHKFKEITPEIIADYVSAGEAHSAAGSRRQQYSDITRTAELFLRGGPFAFPTTLIDTPGTNDPFLVRDEITRRCLESPDMFVFVLSALQPLSPSDISMLRLLNGLNKDRIVVFINRLDQLAEPTSEGAVIKAAVEQRLRREFPARDIPVIVGSAWLGALGHELRSGDWVLDPAQRSALERIGLFRSGASETLSEAERRRLAAVLHETSGMAEISATIGRLMYSAGGAILLQQIAACLLELAQAAEISATTELDTIERLRAARQAEASALAASIAEERHSLEQFRVRAQTIDATFREIEAHLADIIRRGAGTLRNDLQEIVRGFAEELAAEVLNELRQGRRGRFWSFDVGALRERLEAAYLDAFRRMAGDLTRVERFLYPQLEAIAAKLLPNAPEAFRAVPVAPLEPIPCEALSSRVALELGAPWWKQWVAARPSPEEKAQHLKQLVKDEFYPVIEALVRLAETRLAERARDVMARADALSESMLTAIERRKQRLAAQQDLLEGGGGDRQAVRRLHEEQDRRAKALREAKSACALSSEELGRVLRLLEASCRDTGDA
ncbi:MAG TPA: dynamin family protein [Hyphomicrobiaceae bacterium]|nr:dynamin family protein [Hyphomicrobiaceae bacterium]